LRAAELMCPPNQNKGGTIVRNFSRRLNSSELRISLSTQVVASVVKFIRSVPHRSIGPQHVVTMFNDEWKQLHCFKLECPWAQCARRQVAREMVQDHRATIVCLQETKLQLVNDSIIRETLGPQFEGAYAAFRQNEPEAGVIIACSVDYFILQDIETTNHTISACIKNRADNSMWSITGVYGPQGDAEKMLFMDEIKQLNPSMRASWMLLGDFNLIYRASDKNNPNVNRRLMNKFKSIIDELEIKELHLHGRRFTWTSETDDPTI